jgi:hypothetical protein
MIPSWVLPHALHPCPQVSCWERTTQRRPRTTVLYQSNYVRHSTHPSGADGRCGLGATAGLAVGNTPHPALLTNGISPTGHLGCARVVRRSPRLPLWSALFS